MLKWHRNPDPDLEIAWQSDNTPVLAIIHTDRDWYCTFHLTGRPGHISIGERETPKTYAEAKRQCEEAALQLLRARVYRDW